MAFTKSVAGIVPGIMALGLVGHSAQMIPRDWSPKGMKKVEPLHMMKGFTGVMMGIPMVGIVSNQVAALP